MTQPYESNQQVFDIVKKHLLTQMAVARDGFCVYRSSSGLKCAVGCLIPDELYEKRMENGFDYRNLVGEFKSIGNLFQNIDMALLTRLQHLHDGVDPINWEAGLQLIAKQFELEYVDAHDCL